MSSESGDERRSESGDDRRSKAGRTTAKPAEAEQQQCPRCDSTNTKFCYYNNYNLSQPRYFCKACRRYWTQGGTLRNIPVGGGTRRSSFYKRLRTTNTTTTTTNTTTNIATSQVHDSIPVSMVSDMGHGSGNGNGNGLDSGSYLGCEMNLNEALPETGSFSSLLTTRVGNGFMSWPGYGLELGQGLHGVGYGLGLLDWPMEPLSQGTGGGSAAAGGGGNEAVSAGYNTWPMGGGFEAGLARADCFGWPNLKAEKPHLF